MGRLENFIPKLNNHRLSPQGDEYILQFDGQVPISVTQELSPFVKQMGGHLSLKEIFLFLSNKGVFVSIEKSLGLLHHLAKKKLLTNSDDYFALSSQSGPDRKSRPRVSSENREYFSKDRLIALIQKTSLFMACERQVAEELLNHSTLESVKAWDQLIKNGTRSSHFYILLTGEVDVLWKQERLATLGPLSVFGESAAVFDRVRNADVVPCLDSWVLKVDASKIVDNTSPQSFDSYKGLRSRLILNQVLAANPLFKTLPADIMQFFISKCRIEKWGREQTVVEQDGSSGDFYFILKGSVSVVKDGIPVTSLSSGDHFGEVAAMFNEPRTASIITETDCTLLALNQKNLFEVLVSHFRLAVDMEQTARDRKNSSGNILSIFDDEDDLDSLDEQSLSHFEIDQEFLETSQTHFDLEVLDFSTAGK